MVYKLNLKKKPYYIRRFLLHELKTKSLKRIAEENGVSIKTIRRAKCRLGLTLSNQPWSREDIQLLKKEYSTNPRIYALFKSRSKLSVNHKASRLGLNRLQNFHFKEYQVKEDFFNDWSPGSAYVFGLLCSDGTVAKDKRYLGWHINKKDIKILKIIKRLMKSSHPIFIRGEYAQLRINSKRLGEKVSELGCTPRKALRLRFPSIPDKYLRHFVRGYFDGDGSISFNKPNTIKIRILGTKFFLSHLRNKLHKLLEIQRHHIRRYHIYALDYYGDDARRFCKWIYNRSEGVLLRRKYFRYINHINLRRLNGRD